MTWNWKKLFWYWGPGFKRISFDIIMRTIGNQWGTRIIYKYHRMKVAGVTDIVA